MPKSIAPITGQGRVGDNVFVRHQKHMRVDDHSANAATSIPTLPLQRNTTTRQIADKYYAECQMRYAIGQDPPECDISTQPCGPGTFSCGNGCDWFGPETHVPGYWEHTDAAIWWYWKNRSIPKGTVPVWPKLEWHTTPVTAKEAVPEAIKMKCLECPVNHIAPIPRTKQCTPCPPGQVTWGSNRQVCFISQTPAPTSPSQPPTFPPPETRECPAGYFSPGGVHVPPGHECLSGCPSGGVGCTPCPQNTFAALKGSGTCVPCADGQSSAPGSSHCEAACASKKDWSAQATRWCQKKFKSAAKGSWGNNGNTCCETGCIVNKKGKFKNAAHFAKKCEKSCCELR